MERRERVDHVVTGVTWRMTPSMYTSRAKSSARMVNEGRVVLQLNTMDENEYESDIRDVWNRETG